MSNRRVLQFSSDTFWGYRVTVDISRFTCISDLVQHVKDDLSMLLLSNNLQLLIEKHENTRYHIHSPFATIEDLQNHTDRNTVIYVCDHCT